MAGEKRKEDDNKDVKKAQNKNPGFNFDDGHCGRPPFWNLAQKTSEEENTNESSFKIIPGPGGRGTI